MLSSRFRTWWELGIPFDSIFGLYFGGRGLWNFTDNDYNEIIFCWWVGRNTLGIVSKYLFYISRCCCLVLGFKVYDVVWSVVPNLDRLLLMTDDVLRPNQSFAFTSIRRRCFYSSMLRTMLFMRRVGSFAAVRVRKRRG